MLAYQILLILHILALTKLRVNWFVMVLIIIMANTGKTQTVYGMFQKHLEFAIR